MSASSVTHALSRGLIRSVCVVKCDTPLGLAGVILYYAGHMTFDQSESAKKVCIKTLHTFSVQ